MGQAENKNEVVCAPVSKPDANRTPSSPSRQRLALWVLALLLSLVQFCQGAEGQAAAHTTDKSTPPNGSHSAIEVFKPEAEVAAIEKTITNLMESIAPAEKTSAQAAASHHNVVVPVILGLVALLIIPIVIKRINARNGSMAEDPATSVTTAAEAQSFSDFAETFATGPVRNSDTVSRVEEPLPAAIEAQKPEKVSVTDPLGEFLSSAAQDLTTVRDLLSQIGRAADEAARQKLVEEISRQVRSLKGKSELPVMLPVWQLSSALDGLINQLVSKPANVNPSTLRTIASAVDLLSALCIRGLRPDLATEPPVRLLAVDDDAISRHAISFALKKVFKEPELANDGKAGLALAEQNPYDVIFLDVEMPGMDGFELCSKIHDATINKKTPVVFVTRHSDINSRAKSSMTGGRELIGKPFLIFEVAVKALTLVMRSRLEAQGRAREAQAQKPVASEAIVAPAGHLAMA